MSDHSLDSMTYYVRARDADGNYSGKSSMPITIHCSNPTMGKSRVREIFENIIKANPIYADLPFRGLEFDHIWWDEADEIQCQAWTRLNTKLGKDDEMQKIWYTEDGRQLRVGEMELDHAINAWHMCAYMVARMRKKASDAIGGLNNRNISVETRNAFAFVQPVDVFPLYEDIKDHAHYKFVNKFGVQLSDVRKIVFEAWNSGPSFVIDGRYEEAVRFMLRQQGFGGRGQVPMAKLVQFLQNAEIMGDDGFQRMCWNLRIDQPELWRQISMHEFALRLVKKVPPNRLRSALRFKVEKIVQPIYRERDEDLPFDIPFSAGR